MHNINKVTKLTLLFVLLATIVTIFFLPNAASYGDYRSTEIQMEYQNSRDENFTNIAYRKAFELYYQIKKQADSSTTLPSLYMKDSDKLSEEDRTAFTSSVLSNINTFKDQQLHNLNLLYYVVDNDTKEILTNTGVPLSNKELDAPSMTSEYEWYLEFSFDKNGVPSVNYEHSSNGDIASIQSYYNAFNEIFSGEFHLENTETDTMFIFSDQPHEYEAIKNTTFRFAIRDSSNIYGTMITSYRYYPDGMVFRYILIVSVLLAISIGILIFNHKEVIYGMETTRNVNNEAVSQVSLRDIPIEGVIFADMIAFTIACNLGSMAYSIGLGFITLFLLYLFGAYSLWYYALLFKNKDLHKHSLWKYLKEPCHKLYAYALHLDMSNRDTKRLFIIVFANYCLLTFISLLAQTSLDTLILFLIYSAILYVFLRKYILSINKDYHRLLDVIRNIAIGKTNDHIDDDLGIFNPFKPELKDIQTNIETAIAEEVHSQQMKTELITNVSHDLKTPLTSLISYIDLLKKDDLSDAERQKYLDILDKSSLRLKHLVEDLFEVSKANSGNVSLDLMNVDIISLMKQVQVECEDAIKKRKLTIRNTFSDEKIVLKLDSQKTYRIFENLISNISKYTLRGTRVYVDIKDYDTFIEISLKNISAQELNFDVDDITERFMRGDKSRNTEGSGLGLAIVKSFTELQNGTLKIQTDGDLFKVFIRFPKVSDTDN